MKRKDQGDFNLPPKDGETHQSGGQTATLLLNWTARMDVTCSGNNAAER